MFPDQKVYRVHVISSQAMGLCLVLPQVVPAKLVGVLMCVFTFVELVVKPQLATKKEKGEDLGAVINALMRPEEMREHSGTT